MRVQLYDREVDLRSGQVVGRSIEGALREKERQLLAYLVEHAGRTVPRAELYEEVWGYHPATSSRTLDSTVRRLRKAVEADPRRPMHVLSEVGVGYRYAPLPSGYTPAPQLVARAKLQGDTPFFARPTDQEAAQTLLAQGWRCVSLVGRSGVGKTRLAMAVARARGMSTSRSCGSGSASRVGGACSPRWRRPCRRHRWSCRPSPGPCGRVVPCWCSTRPKATSTPCVPSSMG